MATENLSRYPQEFFQLFDKVLAEQVVELNFPSAKEARKIRQRLYAFRHAITNCDDTDEKMLVLALVVPNFRFLIQGRKLTIHATPANESTAVISTAIRSKSDGANL